MPTAIWVPVIRVFPKESGVSTLFRSTVATLGLDETNVHPPGEVEVGGFRVMLLTLSFIMEISPKAPITGAIVSTVNLIEAPADFQF